jgi:hypothetical protein
MGGGKCVRYAGWWGNWVVTAMEGEECIVLVLIQCENFKVTLFEGPNQWEM